MQPAPSAPVTPRKKFPWLVVVSTVVMLLVLGGGIAAYLVLPGLVHDRVVEEAKKRGVLLAFNDLDVDYLDPTTAKLSAVRFRLVGVKGFEGTAKTLDVALTDLQPTRIDGNGIVITVTSSVADLALGIAEWTKAHPKAFLLPVSAKELTVTVAPSPTEPTWLSMDGASLSRGPTGVTFASPKTAFAGVSIGGVGASWSGDALAASMNFGSADPKDAVVQLVIRHSAKPPTATILLAPIDLSRLTGPLGVVLPVPGVRASGRVDLSFVEGLEAGPVSGVLDSRLDGFVPPHPVELDGFLFGTSTTFSSSFTVDAARSVVTLTQSHVKAGAFELNGGGRIERRDALATILMDLSGYLPCAAVAQSAAAAHVGSFLATMIGDAARRVLEGSVSVRVKLSADTRDLGNPVIERTIGVGCGLTPLKGLDPKLLQQIPGALQDFAKQLPPLPDFHLPGEASKPATTEKSR